MATDTPSYPLSMTNDKDKIPVTFEIIKMVVAAFTKFSMKHHKVFSAGVNSKDRSLAIELTILGSTIIRFSFDAERNAFNIWFSKISVDETLANTFGLIVGSQAGIDLYRQKLDLRSSDTEEKISQIFRIIIEWLEMCGGTSIGAEKISRMTRQLNAEMSKLVEIGQTDVRDKILAMQAARKLKSDINAAREGFEKLTRELQIKPAFLKFP